MSGIRFAFVLLIAPGLIGAASSQWTDLGGSLGGKAVVAKNSDGRIEVFVRWQDNTLRHIYQTAAGGTQWSSWSNIGSAVSSNPAVAMNSDGTLEVFAIGTDSALWHTRQTSAGSANWTTWASLGGSGKNDPAVAANADGRLEVFFETSKDSMWHMWETAPSGNWSAGDEIVGNLVQSPSVGVNSDGRLVVFTGDDDGKFWWTIQNTAGQDSFASWWCLLGGTISAPLFGTNSDKSLELFAVRADNSAWTSRQTPAGSYTYADWSSLSGAAPGGIGVGTDSNGALELFGVGSDNALWYTAQAGPGGSWSGWSSLGSSLTSAPGAITDSNGLLQVFARGSDNGLWYTRQSSPGAWAVGAVPGISSTNTLIPVWQGSSGFSSNMFATIYGTNLSQTTEDWSKSFTGGAAPTSLGGVSVTVNGIPAFVQYVSPTQININAPDDGTTGPVNIVVKNGAGTSNTGTAMRGALSPTLLSQPNFSAGSTNYVVAQTPDFGSFIGPPNLVSGATFVAAKPGDTVIIYGTGCGPTTPATQAGVLAAQNSPLALPYQMTIGGMPANASFAGMVQGTVGLYQFNIVIPEVAAGDQPIALTVNGVSNGQTLFITVGK